MSDALFRQKAPGIMRALIADFDLAVEDRRLGTCCAVRDRRKGQKPPGLRCVLRLLCQAA